MIKLKFIDKILIYFYYLFSYICDLSDLSSHINTSQTEKQNKRNQDDNIMSLAFKQEKEFDKRMSPDGTRKLQDEINMLTKRNCELESQLKSLEAGHSRDIHIDSTDGADIGKIYINSIKIICFFNLNLNFNS